MMELSASAKFRDSAKLPLTIETGLSTLPQLIGGFNANKCPRTVSHAHLHLDVDEIVAQAKTVRCMRRYEKWSDSAGFRHQNSSELRLGFTAFPACH
jgi:hypothetical protein